jgi:hypothetical protein
MRFAALALALALCPRSAAAQTTETCVLLPHASDEVPAAMWERVDGAVSEALRARGFVVLAARDAQLRMMGQPMEDCGAIECAPDVNRFLGTAFAVLTELTWSRARPSAVNVVLIGVESGHSAGAQAAVERPAALEESTLSAFGVAWDRWEADRQGQLIVESSPEGAFVEVDGVSVGRAPLRRLVPIGVHTLRFALEGYVTETREITIDRHEERTVSVSLGPLGRTSAADVPASPTGAIPAPADRSHPWANWLLGGGLVAAGLGLAVQPLVVIALNRQPAGGGLLYTPTDGDWALAGTLLALSGASLVAGAVVLAVQPIRESVKLTAGLGRLDLQVSF